MNLWSWNHWVAGIIQREEEEFPQKAAASSRGWFIELQCRHEQGVNQLERLNHRPYDQRHVFVDLPISKTRQDAGNGNGSIHELGKLPSHRKPNIWYHLNSFASCGWTCLTSGINTHLDSWGSGTPKFPNIKWLPTRPQTMDLHPPTPFRAQKAAKAGEVASSRWHALVEPLQEKISMLESWLQRFTKHLFYVLGCSGGKWLELLRTTAFGLPSVVLLSLQIHGFFMSFSSSHPRRPIATRSQIHHMTSYLFNHHLRPFAKCRSLCTADICSLEVPGLVVMPCFKEPMKWHEQHHRIHHLFWKILKSIWHVHQFSSTLRIHYACLCDRPRRPPFEQLVREPSKWNQPERGKAGETCNLRRFAIFLSLKGRKEEHGGVEMRQVIS